MFFVKSSTMRITFMIGIAFGLMLSMAPRVWAESSPLQLVKVINRVNLSSFSNVYIEPVKIDAVDFGTESAKDEKSLENTRATLPEAALHLKATLQEEIAKTGLPLRILDTAPTPADNTPALVISMEITEFNPGSRLKRAFGGLFGAGKVTVGVKGNLRHHQSDAIVAQFYHEGHAAWTYAGEKPKRLLMNATEDVAKDLSAYIQANWVQMKE